jgi:hypothetical protein
MNKYRKSIFVTAWLISIPSLPFLISGIMSLSLTRVGLWGGILVLWWGSYLYLRNEGKHAFWLSFTLVNLLWWPLLWRTISRILFVMENGGMERADGYGSPMAFLIGLIVEQWFFMPLTFVFLFGIFTIRGLRVKTGP